MARWIVHGLFLISALPAAARPARTVATEGWLHLSSMTAGASVFIDGNEVGAVPLPGPVKLPTGKHTLKIVKRGYAEYMDVFTIRRGKTTDLDIDLLPYAGIVEVSASVPDARVFIDGKYEGTAPLEKEVLIGKRTIRVSRAGYHDFIVVLSSVAGRVIEVRAKLRALPVGSSPYRPPPPPPPRWYERWYVWAGIAGGLAAVTVAIAVPAAQANRDQLAEKGPFDHHFVAGQ